MPRRAPHHVAMVAFADAQMLDVVGPLEVFSRASRLATDEGRRAGPPPYRVEILARAAGPVVMSSTLAIVAARAYGRVRGGIDTLMVAGGRGTDRALEDRALIRWLRTMAPKTSRVASVCTGAFLLAEAGLLDGRKATTQWLYCDSLSSRHPKIDVDPEPIFVRDGPISTSAGVTTGIDLALALVEEDRGRDVALAIARGLVMFLRRPGGQSQFSAQLSGQVAHREPLRDVQRLIAEHPEADLSVPALAAAANLSPRQFSRAFTAETGVPPGRYVDRVRLETARRLLEDTADGVAEIARRAGYGTPEAMRRAFLQALGVSPAEYRRRF